MQLVLQRRYKVLPEGATPAPLQLNRAPAGTATGGAVAEPVVICVRLHGAFTLVVKLAPRKQGALLQKSMPWHTFKRTYTQGCSPTGAGEMLDKLVTLRSTTPAFIPHSTRGVVGGRAC